MDLAFPPEAGAFRSEVRTFLAEHLPADWRGLGALDRDEAEAFSNRWRRTLAEHPREKPLFLLLHTYEAHDPYGRKEPPEGSDDPARVAAGAAVVDIIMSRQPTPVLRLCRERGVQAEAGFEMLVQQIPEYCRFFGFDTLAQTLQTDLSEVRSLLFPM